MSMSSLRTTKPILGPTMTPPPLAASVNAPLRETVSGPRGPRQAVGWRNATRFIRRHVLAFGLIAASGSWALLTGLWDPGSISAGTKGAIEFGASTFVAIIAIVVGHRSDLTDARHAAAMRALEDRRRILGTAVEQTVEAVVITDPDGSILYVNSAFERVTGYAAAEVTGRNPRLLHSGQQSAAFYTAMWATLTAGRPWVGELINRRKDGTLYRDEATITPILDEQGRIATYVAVQRDVTRLRDLESSLDAMALERAAIAASLSALPSDGTLEATAMAICRELVKLPDVDFATLCSFDGPSDVVIVATAGMEMPPGLRLPPTRAGVIRARAAAGTWSETWRNLPDDAFGRAVEAAGARAAALSPIGNGEGQVGLLLIGALSDEHAEHLVERIPALVEFAASAQGLVGGKLLARRDEAAVRARLRAVIDARAYHPVYQPILDLRTGRPIGFEALTRFDDRTPPDEVFAAAQRTGLGDELEAATLNAAVRGSAKLPAGTWLSLNASPGFILSGGLAMILARRTRPVVVEITEHETIADYAPIREAIAVLGADVRVAVDDAGAGHANFHHMVELRPDYVKVDISLIRNVNADLTRQALIVGLLHFARATDGRIIAEGIETEEELATLASLDVHFGQGFLLGRPLPAAGHGQPGRPRAATALPVSIPG